MSKLEDFKAAKARQDEAQVWAEMLGKAYTGGGGGVGEIRTVALGNPGAVIYYQRTNGSQNYWNMPQVLNEHLEAAIKDAFPKLLKSAMDRMAGATRDAAAEAEAEYAELRRAAGLGVKG